MNCSKKSFTKDTVLLVNIEENKSQRYENKLTNAKYIYIIFQLGETTWLSKHVSYSLRGSRSSEALMQNGGKIRTTYQRLITLHMNDFGHAFQLLIKHQKILCQYHGSTSSDKQFKTHGQNHSCMLSWFYLHSTLVLLRSGSLFGSYETGL